MWETVVGACRRAGWSWTEDVAITFRDGGEAAAAIQDYNFIHCDPVEQ